MTAAVARRLLRPADPGTPTMTTTLEELRPDDGPLERDPGLAGEPEAQTTLQVARPGVDQEPEPVSGVGAAYAAIEHLAISGSPGVDATDDWAAAGGKVLGFHLSRMLAHVPGTVLGEDPEEVHAMRVAARRVRAAWRVFGDGFERAVVRDQVGRLRILGSELGAVRDLDVQLSVLIAARERGSKRDRAGLGPLIEAWSAERAERHRELVERLTSRWFTAFVIDQEQLVTSPGEAVKAVAPHAPSTLRNRAPSIIWEAYQAVRSYDDAVVDADAGTLHELRISAKWLRYTLEFLREPMEPRATELIRRVVVVQDHLGDIHDLHASAARARSSAGSSDLPANERSAIDAFATNAEARVERLRRRTGPAWRGVVDTDYRRGLGRALASL
jgi:CHAD domain-containing protein